MGCLAMRGENILLNKEKKPQDNHEARKHANPASGGLAAWVGCKTAGSNYSSTRRDLDDLERRDVAASLLTEGRGVGGGPAGSRAGPQWRLGRVPCWAGGGGGLAATGLGD